ncbi:MAG: YggS family pyridoxal phosphate-dependent enzyme [Bacteroidetes bacterium]|nr:YggS family pyridoxal phosphate-dependent enzyme [Bacteroidota bacterium]
MIKDNLKRISEKLPENVNLIVVTKLRSDEEIMQVYNEGYRSFGENKVQDLVKKWEKLPKDIKWDMIGHLQSNKVKYIAPFINLIHSVESAGLAAEIDKQAMKNKRIIDILLQFHVADEESKFGENPANALGFCRKVLEFKNIRIRGIMGMATLTNDENKIRNEFKALKNTFEYLKKTLFQNSSSFSIISMGMSSDYKIAIEEGSNMVRIGSSVFL